MAELHWQGSAINGATPSSFDRDGDLDDDGDDYGDDDGDDDDDDYLPPPTPSSPRPPEDLWAFFDSFSPSHVAAMAPCMYHYGSARNKVTINPTVRFFLGPGAAQFIQIWVGRQLGFFLGSFDAN